MKNLKRNISKVLIVAGFVLYGQFGVCSAPAEVSIFNEIHFGDGQVMSSEQAQKVLQDGKLFPAIDQSMVFLWAVQKNRLDLLPLLLKHPTYKKSLNKPDKGHGLSPLGLAAVKGHGQVAQLLIEAGADTDFRDREKMTPFMRAAFNGQFNMFQFLYVKAADKNKMIQATFVKDGVVRNALGLAAEGACPKTVAYLLDHGSGLVQSAFDYACLMRDNFEFYKLANEGMSQEALKKANAKIITLLNSALKQKAGADRKRREEKADKACKKLELELACEEQKKKDCKNKIKMNADKAEQERQAQRAENIARELAEQKKAQENLAQEVAQKEAQKRAEEALKKEKERHEHDEFLALLKQEMEQEAAIEAELKVAQEAQRIKAEKKAKYDKGLALYVQKRDEKKRKQQDEDAQRLVNRFAPKSQQGNVYYSYFEKK